MNSLYLSLETTYQYFFLEYPLISNFHDKERFIYFKLNNEGKLIWSRSYDGKRRWWSLFNSRNNDGGYIVAGSTNSYRAGKSNFYILKLDREW